MKAITRIVHPIAEALEAGICEVQCENGKCFYLKTSNIANEVEKPSRKMKTTNLAKPRKWWDEMDKQMQVLRASLMAFANNLTTKEDQMLERFKIECTRKEANGKVPTEDSLDESNSIQKAISFFLNVHNCLELLKSMHHQAKARNKGGSHQVLKDMKL